MYSDRTGVATASHEALSTELERSSTDQDPQKTEGFLIPEASEITHIHGEVKLRGIDSPIRYEGSMPHDGLTSKFINLAHRGFGGIKGSLQGLSDALAAKEGVFTIEIEQGRSTPRDLDPQRVHEESIRAVTQDIPNNKELADAPNGDKIDFSKFYESLHSMAAISGSRHALSYPDEVAGIIYLNPVGFEPDAEFAKYLRRIGPCAVQEILPGLIKREFKGHFSPLSAIHIGKHLLGNLPHTIGEIYTCHTSDLRKDAARIGRLGIKQAVILGGNDSLVRAEASASHAKHIVDHCEIVPGFDHFGPQKQPARTAQIVSHFIRDFA